jgi:hypothetical protein
MKNRRFPVGVDRSMQEGKGRETKKKKGKLSNLQGEEYLLQDRSETKVRKAGSRKQEQEQEQDQREEEAEKHSEQEERAMAMEGSSFPSRSQRRKKPLVFWLLFSMVFLYRRFCAGFLLLLLLLLLQHLIIQVRFNV